MTKKTKITNGILLTGGTGSRLAPLTNIFNKHLLPTINNKFIIDYPLRTLKYLGVENLTIVLGGNHFEQIVKYLTDGSDWGFNINYCFQQKPLGIAHAINLCKNFMDDEQFIALLGDNLYQYPISNHTLPGKAKIVLNKHPELYRFGVATINGNKISKIEEKPKFIDTNQKNYAITGCYFLDHNFFDYFKSTEPSSRGEYEITSILDKYNQDNRLMYSIADGWWIDAGTLPSLMESNLLLLENQTKKCLSCEKEMSINDYYLIDGKPGTYCKICDQKRRKIDYYSNHNRELENKSKYYKNNKDKVIKSNSKSASKRRSADPEFRIRSYVSTAINVVLKNSKTSKHGSSCIKYLPYSISELKSHLESQFEYWMTWQNHGRYNSKKWDDNDSSTWTWQIDHIIPQSDLPYSSMEDDNFKKCWSLENLRPLSAKQNLLNGVKLKKKRKNV